MEEILNLQEITRGYAGLTEISGAHLLEGCIAALWLHDHPSNLRFYLTGPVTKTYTLVYPEHLKTERLANTWKDQRYATEQGAACIGILLALKLTNNEVIERAVRKTGIDYWIGKSGDGILFFKKARLEVSGIHKGNNSRINARFLMKCKQTRQSENCTLCAYVSVMEFSKPVAKFGST
jgi:hypothetical protein